MDRVGISINDLEFQLKNNRKIWDKLNLFINFGKDSISIVEAIRGHYESPKNNHLQRKIIAGHQLCDILRRFEVYETTLGEEIIE